MAKVVLVKEPLDNFGFSIADGLFESGVYVKRVRRQGPADVAGVQRFDKILLVNGVSAKDANVDQLLPLIDACEAALELTICRHVDEPLIDVGSAAVDDVISVDAVDDDDDPLVVDAGRRFRRKDRGREAGMIGKQK